MKSIQKITRLVLACLMASCFVAPCLSQQTDSQPTEDELLAVLRSDAPASEKAITCKRLAIYGSSASVSELAKLLPDPQLSSWARIALEAIPGRDVDDALLDAANSLKGKQLVGVINSIGVRRDKAAIRMLSERLHDSDVEVASAAAYALGQIGNDLATMALMETLDTEVAEVRSSVAEGLILCAERLHESGVSGAVEIFDKVRSAELPKQRIVEATRGAILARGSAGVPLLMEQFRSEDVRMFQLALSTARELPGLDVDRALAEELPKAEPDRAALLIQAMADRKETVILSAVLDAASDGPMPVRLSAINALSRVGDVSCVDALLNTAQDDNANLVAAAKSTLSTMPGEQVDAKILAMLPRAKIKTYPLLIEIVGQRRLAATDELVKALKHSNQDVRSAALTALGQTVGLDDLSILISQVVSPTQLEDAQTAQSALRMASVRMPDRDACALALSRALNRSSDMTKGAILEIIAEVGGDQALETVGAAANSDDATLQDAGSRLLGKWNNLDAAPILLELAKSGPAEKYRIRGLRGYIGIIRKFSMSNEQRADMCRSAFEAATRLAEKELVLDVIQLYPSSETFSLAMSAMQDNELKQKATQSALVIAQKLGNKNIDVQQMLADAGFDKVDLEIVKAVYGAGSTFVDVTSIVKKHASDLPIIALPSGGYNSSFGGDPLPGVVKQLKIEYRIDGQPNTATFAENALIILPPPK